MTKTYTITTNDTTITYTISPNRADTVIHVTAQGRRIVQYILDAEHVAARLRNTPLGYWLTPDQIEAKVQARRAEIRAALEKLNAETMGAAEYRQAARAIRATAREYQRVQKKGAVVTE